MVVLSYRTLSRKPETYRETENVRNYGHLNIEHSVYIGLGLKKQTVKYFCCELKINGFILLIKINSQSSSLKLCVIKQKSYCHF